MARSALTAVLALTLAACTGLKSEPPLTITEQSAYLCDARKYGWGLSTDVDPFLSRAPDELLPKLVERFGEREGHREYRRRVVTLLQAVRKSEGLGAPPPAAEQDWWSCMNYLLALDNMNMQAQAAAEAEFAESLRHQEQMQALEETNRQLRQQRREAWAAWQNEWLRDQQRQSQCTLGVGLNC